MESTSEKDGSHSLRLNKILEMRYENDPDTLEALKQLSTFYNENTVYNRRNLRSAIEKETLHNNETVLSSLHQVKQAFDLVYHDIVNVKKSMDDMTSRLQNTKIQTKQLLDQTKRLQTTSETNKMKEAISQALIDKFQLTDEELVILHGNRQKDGNLTEDIFTVLERIKTIHANCKILMQSGHQTLASDIMEQMTLHEERAMERMYKWLQNNTKNLDNPEMVNLITKTVSRLQSRHILFKYVIDDYCTFRRSVVTGDFINALTRGGPSGNPAPIELKAHDPQIYITDMLVWISKAATVEKQKFQLLLKASDTSDTETAQMLNKSFLTIYDDVCQPLKLRIEKILAVPLQSSVIYAIVNLIRYYKKCICKMVEGGTLFKTLNELQAHSENSFLHQLQYEVNTILSNLETVPSRDLSTPTVTIVKLLSLLRDMLSSASMSEGREIDTCRIAKLIVDPLLTAVNEQVIRLSSVNMAVYMLNCMYALYVCLSLYEYMEDRLERLQAQSDAQIDTLTSEQASSLVAKLNLGPIYTILQDYGSQGPLSTIPGMEPSVLKTLGERIEYLIRHPEEVVLPQLTLLACFKHKKAVEKRAFDVILTIYRQLYEGVHNPNNLYENPETILNKLPDELDALLHR